MSDRIARVRMEFAWFETTLITIYAPTEDADEDAKDAFYEQLVMY